MVVFDVGAMISIDASAIFSLFDIVSDFKGRGINVAFVKFDLLNLRLRGDCIDAFRRAGLVELVGEEGFFGKIRTALVYYGFEIEDGDDEVSPVGNFVSYSDSIIDGV